jgi:Lrp/AsnC family leucine-responsive transcriptional regulator
MPSMFATFDRLDKKILLELDQNAAIPLSQLARKVGVGSDLVEYRVRRYVESGLIGCFSPVIDPTVLGFCVYKTYLKLSMSQKRIGNFSRELLELPSLYWLMHCYGSWDIQVSFAARSPMEYHEVFSSSIGKYASTIRSQMVCTTLKVARFTKNYLIRGGDSVITWGDSGLQYEADSDEQNILKLLSMNCRAPIQELADKSNLSPAVVRHRINKLESKGVIRGYRLQFNYAVFGFMVFKVFVCLRNFSPSTLRQMYEFAKAEPHITCFILQIGPVQVELEVEVADFQQFVGIIEKFSERFSESIVQTDYTLMKEDYYHRVPTAWTK